MVTVASSDNVPGRTTSTYVSSMPATASRADHQLIAVIHRFEREPEDGHVDRTRPVATIVDTPLLRSTASSDVPVIGDTPWSRPRTRSRSSAPTASCTRPRLSCWRPVAHRPKRRALRLAPRPSAPERRRCSARPPLRLARRSGQGAAILGRDRLGGLREIGQEGCSRQPPPPAPRPSPVRCARARSAQCGDRGGSHVSSVRGRIVRAPNTRSSDSIR